MEEDENHSENEFYSTIKSVSDAKSKQVTQINSKNQTLNQFVTTIYLNNPEVCSKLPP